MLTRLGNIALIVGEGIEWWLIIFLRVAAFLRRSDTGARRHDVVLDIGSGHRPHPRADVLCDRFLESNYHRAGELVRDRPFVIGDVTALPFGDRSFDFIICQHVLEHVDNVQVALEELQRVGSGGYIETPAPLWEWMFGRAYHLWFVSLEGSRLVFRRKSKTDVQRSVVEAFVRLSETSKALSRIVLSHPSEFVTVLRWSSQIDYSIVGPSGDDVFDEPLRADGEDWPARQKPLSGWQEVARRGALLVVRRLLGFRRRPIDLARLLACPQCKGRVEPLEGSLRCSTCRLAYPIRDGIPVMLREEAYPL